MLTRDHLADAGARLVRVDGLDALSLRAVAAALDVTPMALYRHVDDADDLTLAVLDRLLAALPDVPAGGPWPDRYRRWAHAARAALTPYPGLARHVLQHWTELDRPLAVVEQLLGARDDVAAANAVFTYVLMRVDAEQAIRAAGTVQRRLRRLGPDHPRLRANAAQYAVARFDEHFAHGLDALLLGLAKGPARARA